MKIARPSQDLPSQDRLVTHHRTFDDIDEFTTSLSGWNADWYQIEPGRLRVRTELTQAKSTAIQRYYFSHTVRQRGIAPRGAAMFGFPDQGPRHIWAGREVEGSAVMDFRNNSGYEALTESGFSALAISVPDATLASLRAQMAIDPGRLSEDGHMPLPAVDQRHPLVRLQQHVRRLYDRLSEERTLASSRWAMAALDRDLPVYLLTALESTRPAPRWGRSCAREKGLRRAIDFIEAKGFDNPSIPEICAAAGLSWRSLNRAFQERFGIGPKRYLTAYRLGRVRRQLKVSTPDAKVIDIANDWGFWHPGDFARAYRGMFGEHPKDSKPD